MQLKKYWGAKKILVEINNPSSPGASFTDNTNSVILKVDEWINSNAGLTLEFRKFRERLEIEKGINDNNNRNIFPLLKNVGFAEYDRQHPLFVDAFFTGLGKSYVDVLKSMRNIEISECDAMNKEYVRAEFAGIANDLIYNGLENLLKNNNTNYSGAFRNVVKYLIKFQKINKREFAYLIYAIDNGAYDNEMFEENIKRFRTAEIDIDVNVVVRNDLQLKNSTKKSSRKEPLSFLTAYTYFISLLEQAGLISKKTEGYYEIIDTMKDRLYSLG